MASKKNKKAKAKKKTVAPLKSKLKKKPVKKAAAKKVINSKKKKKVSSKTVRKNVKQPTKKVTSRTVKAKKSVVSQPKVRRTVDYTKAITPLADRLVVRVLNAEKVTAGGLIIPATASFVTGYLKALVLAVGGGVKGKRGQIRPLDVKIGDHVLFAEYAGTKVNFHSEELHIIHESDVMGVLQD
jgi:chaperonin GroES